MKIEEEGIYNLNIDGKEYNLNEELKMIITVNAYEFIKYIIIYKIKFIL